MTEIPSAVLSEQFQERLQGRRLVSAIFTTFRFDPGFFESEILPAFLDVPCSHASAIKLVQLEEALKSLGGTIAVYYDHHGLVADAGTAKLDVRRYPIHHESAIFHPKNVLALVEATDPDESGHRERALLCSCSSANLTRAGWWENVEVAHIEEIREGERTTLRDDLIEYVDALVKAVEGRRANDELRASHGAAHDIREFLRGTAQRERRSSNGKLFTHFHNGKASLVDFIEGVAGSSLQGFCLEVISPYFDRGNESAPLALLMERFAPSEVRLFLPRNDRGEALCTEGLFRWVRNQEGVAWGALPGALLRLGKSEDTKHRTVHAKVYRFFEPKKGGREVLYLGSTNLTTPGCREAGNGSNWETGFLVEVTSGGRPEWWLSAETKQPPVFKPRDEDEGTATSGGTRLTLRFDWKTKQATALWKGSEVSPTLTVKQAGVLVFELTGLLPAEASPLSAEQSQRLEERLKTSALFEVTGENSEPGLLLVQEEGMSHRPSLLLELSAADILRYWALLTVEQRAAFIEARVAVAGDDDPLLAKLPPLPAESTLFDRFAGLFHAFGCLEERVRDALTTKREREANYRLFGNKYDSLGTLLDRVFKEVESGTGDRVEQYVVTLCTEQLLRELRKAFPTFYAENKDEFTNLEARLGGAARLRSSLAESGPEMPGFLDWFDRWFLQRAVALSTEEAS